MKIKLNTVALALILVLFTFSTQTLAVQNTSEIYGNTTNVTQKKTYDKELFNVLEAEDIGLTEKDKLTISNPNVAIEKLGTDSITTYSTNSTTVEDAFDSVPQDYYQYLRDTLGSIQNESRRGFTVERILKVYHIMPTYANVEDDAYVTKKTIRFQAPEDIEEFRIEEYVSEKAISNTSRVHFNEPTPKVVTEKPFVFHWDFSKVNESQNISVTYYVKGILVGNEGTQIISTGIPENIENDTQAGNQITGMMVSEDDLNAEQEDSLMRMGLIRNLIAMSVGIALFFILCIIIMEMEDRDAFRGIKNFGRNIDAFARVGWSNKKIIDNYIKECLENGYHWEDIRISLVRAGWSRKAVKRLINKYR